MTDDEKNCILQILKEEYYISYDNDVEILGDGWIAITKFMISDDDIEELSHILPIEEYEIENNDSVFDDFEIDDVLYIKIRKRDDKNGKKI